MNYISKKIKEILNRIKRQVTFCIPDDRLYLTNPPQLKCKRCGKMWRVDEDTPVCDYN